MPKVNGLNARQAMFVQEYPVDLNAAKAALRAGYSPRSAKQIGMETMTKTPIAFAIDVAMAKRRESTEVSQVEVIQELAAIAFANIANVAEWSGGSVKVLDSAPRPKTALAAVAQVSEGAGPCRRNGHGNTFPACAELCAHTRVSRVFSPRERPPNLTFVYKFTLKVRRIRRQADCFTPNLAQITRIADRSLSCSCHHV